MLKQKENKEQNLKRMIKLIGKNASLDNIDKSLHLTNIVIHNLSNSLPKQQAKNLENDLEYMKSNGHINHIKVQSDIASLFMFA